jgi:hypothetical protein
MKWFTLGCAAVVAAACSAGVSAAPDADLWPMWQASDESNGAAVDHSAWQEFLDGYVETDTASGVNLVGYAAVGDAERASLRAYLASLQATDPRRYARTEQLAYWINLYNAATVDLVLNHPDEDSIRRMGGGLFAVGPWNDEILEVAGVALTLNDIEHRILRPIWRDRRIHFAVNCASMSCPNLRKTAYTGANVERLLRENEHAYINDPRGVRFTARGRLELSRIFDWYRDDFAPTTDALLDYVARHADEPLAARLRAYDGKIDYEYDWSLNAAD